MDWKGHQQTKAVKFGRSHFLLRASTRLGLSAYTTTLVAQYWVILKNKQNHNCKQSGTNGYQVNYEKISQRPSM